MGFFHKEEQKVSVVSQVSPKKDYYPLIHIAKSIKDYQQNLVQKEVASLEELHEIQSSFDDVLESDEALKSDMLHFSDVFDSLGNAAGQFEQVKMDISASVESAQKQMENLRGSSRVVKDDFEEMQNTFRNLVEAVDGIANYTSQITSVADQTNILALNASIEAARAGDLGKGFAVVAVEVKNLAQQIKVMVQAVENTIESVKKYTEEFNQSIGKTTGALERNMDNLENVDSVFETINRAANGADDVQNQITRATAEANEELNSVNQAFDRISSRYQNVSTHISKANDLGTTKSVMFENIDNMLAQVEPLVKEYSRES